MDGSEIWVFEVVEDASSKDNGDDNDIRSSTSNDKPRTSSIK